MNKASSEFDEKMLRRALGLASRGVGLVSPGPLVGCVIVDANGEVAGEGFYVYEEVKHAETVALSHAAGRARGGTAYVSLEPHAHHGRTAPCTGALIEAGVCRVVAPIKDPNPDVSGKGFAYLRAAGIEVETGLLAEEAERLNEKYLHFMNVGRPFVHLKLAVSIDGKIATRTGDSRWISGDESRARVQQLRHEYDAVLIGSGTALLDDPQLTDRSGLRRRRPLLRVVLDDSLKTPLDSKLVSTAGQAPLLIFSSGTVPLDRRQAFASQGVEVVRTERRDLLSVLLTLASRSIQSVLIEGGARVAGDFIDADLVDKVTFFVAPKIIGGQEAPSAIGGKGVERMADAVSLTNLEVVHRGADIEITGYPKRRSNLEGR